MAFLRSIFPAYQEGSAGNIFSGMFGDAGGAYRDASGQLERYLPEAKGYQLPFFNAGTQALPDLQNWLNTMKDPSGFMNNLMGQYKQSPYATYLQDQAMKAGTNAASASGLLGSTPFAREMEQTASGIASGDMNQWLQNVLGINTQYGAGEAGLASMGQGAGNALSNLIGNYAAEQAGLRFGEKQAKEQQRGGLFGGIAGMFGL